MPAGGSDPPTHSPAMPRQVDGKHLDDYVKYVAATNAGSSTAPFVSLRADLQKDPHLEGRLISLMEEQRSRAGSEAAASKPLDPQSRATLRIAAAFKQEPGLPSSWRSLCRPQARSAPAAKSGPSGSGTEAKSPPAKCGSQRALHRGRAHGSALCDLVG